LLDVTGLSEFFLDPADLVDQPEARAANNDGFAILDAAELEDRPPDR